MLNSSATEDKQSTAATQCLVRSEPSATPWGQQGMDLHLFHAAVWFKLLYQVSGLAVNEEYCNTQAVTSTFSNSSFMRDLKGSSSVADGKYWIACYKVLSKQSSLMWPTFILGAHMSQRPFEELVQTMTALFVY